MQLDFRWNPSQVDWTEAINLINQSVNYVGQTNQKLHHKEKV